MPQVRKLRIAKNLKKVSITDYHTVLRIKLIIFAICLVYYMHEATVESTIFYPGHKNPQLQHDIVAWSKECSTQFPSSWRAIEPFINGSSYCISILDGLSWIFVAFFDLRGTLEVMKCILTYMFHFYVYVARLLVRRYGIRNLLLYLLFCFTLAVLVTCGGYEIMMTMTRLASVRTIKWLDSNIIIFDASEETNTSTPPSGSIKQEHPATKGEEPPYYLYTFYRYNKEDVVFQCEYLAISLEDAYPIYKTSGWRKHGVPVIPNERLHVDIKIRVLEDGDVQVFPPGRLYSVVTTLTINLIDDNDYGAYTCDFYNPMKWVRPGPKMTENYTAKTKHGPSSPDPTCGCKPRPQPPKCECYETPQTPGAQQECREERPPPPKRYQCFAEFLLRKVPDVTQTLEVNPGSILIYTAPYTTVADENDLEYDVTSFSKDSKEHDCCSVFVGLYWIFTNSFRFQEFPYSRLIQSNNGFFFQRGQCLCKSSFGTTIFSLRRWFYNVTTGISELVDISHPSKLQLIPHITHPFSETNESTTRNFTYSAECLDSDLSSDNCATQDYLLEKAIEYFLLLEKIIFTVGFSSSSILVFVVILLTHRLCILPCTTACLNYGRARIPFDTVNGPPLGTLKPCHRGTVATNDRFGANGENEEEGNQCEGNNNYYDVFLSYDDEEPYDLMVAQFLKKRLQEMNRSVFDVMTDIPYGRLLLTETARAILRSSRFVVIASKGYIETKVLEYDVIQSTIVSQYSKPKHRLLIISVEECEIVGIQRVPCIHLPKGLRDRDVMDQDSEIKFEVWERNTRPQSNGEIHNTVIRLDSAGIFLDLLESIFPLTIIFTYWYFTMKLLTANWSLMCYGC